MESVKSLMLAVLNDFVGTLQVNWPYLILAITVAAVLRTYVGTNRIQAALSGRPWITIPAAVLFATVTPFCSCGTEAVVLGMMAGSVPWAPIIAFMVSSPLTSPEELLYSAGLFGWGFAAYYFVGATVLGLVAGLLTHLIESKGWLNGQARMRVDNLEAEPGCCTRQDNSSPPANCCGPEPSRVINPALYEIPALSAALLEGGQLPYEPAAILVEPRWTDRLKLPALGANLWSVARRLVVFFTAFVLLGYLIIELVPNHIFETYLGDSSTFAIPLAALLGIPFYLNSDASLPLVASLVANGMGQGTAIAFLVTGAGTSIGAIAGSLVIARRRVVGLVIGFLLIGAIILGELAQLFF